MHTLTTSFVLGYHGCDRDVAEVLLRGDDFKGSDNDYDWLGPGIYFWEANPRRGLQFARELAALRRGRDRIRTPAVVGAVIDLGLCLDLTTTAGIEQVRSAHESFVALQQAAALPLPKNHDDGLRRHLDCAVVRMLHRLREKAGEPTIDSVRGVFVEGRPIYETAGFHEKTHIQICVTKLERIKGMFRVPARLLTD